MNKTNKNRQQKNGNVLALRKKYLALADKKLADYNSMLLDEGVGSYELIKTTAQYCLCIKRLEQLGMNTDDTIMIL